MANPFDPTFNMGEPRAPEEAPAPPPAAPPLPK